MHSSEIPCYFEGIRMAEVNIRNNILFPATFTHLLSRQYHLVSYVLLPN